MKDDFGRTSPRDHNLRMTFLSAAQNGGVDLARDILYQGVLNGETLDRALHVAVAEYQTSFVSFLVEEVQMDISRAGPEALANAVRLREPEIVDILTRRNELKLTPETPLDIHYIDLAIIQKEPYDPRVLQLLLDRGAQPVHAGFDALETALRENNADALQRIMKRSPACKARLGDKLTAAAMRLDPAGVKMLLAAGVNAAHEQGAPLKGLIHQMLDTPGRDAQRIFDCAKLLVNAGGAPDDVAKDLLKAAVRTKNAPLIGLMLERGTDIEPEMRGVGYNRMVLAATYGFSALVERFHQEGTHDDAYGEALSVAAETGNRDLVRQMLTYEKAQAAKIDLAFCATVGGQVDFVRELIAQGHSTDFTHKVLVEAVVEGDHGAMLDFLLDQGAARAVAEERCRILGGRGQSCPDVHATLEKWAARRETVYYNMPDIHCIADLRRTTEMDLNHQPVTELIRRIKANRFDEVMKVIRNDTAAKIERADLLATDAAGNNALEVLGARGLLKDLFAPDLWADRRADFSALYAEVPPVYRDQIDCQGLLSRWRQQDLARDRAKIPRLK